LIRQTDIAVHVSMMNIPLPDAKITVELRTDGREQEVGEGVLSLACRQSR